MGRIPPDEVKAIAVEQWLRSLSLAPKTKTHIRNLMHLLYENASRWELIDRNPIELVRQSSSASALLGCFASRSFGYLQELTEPYRTMVLVAACLGLRVSEIIGLQWGDFNWENSTVLMQRSVVQARVGDTKTEYSRRPLPVHPSLESRCSLGVSNRFYDEQSRLGIRERCRATTLAGDYTRNAISSRQHRVPVSGKLGGTLSGIPTQRCFDRWRRCEGAAGAVAPRRHSDDSERVHAGGVGGQARCQQ